MATNKQDKTRWYSPEQINAAHTGILEACKESGFSAGSQMKLHTAITLAFCESALSGKPVKLEMGPVKLEVGDPNG